MSRFDVRIIGPTFSLRTSRRAENNNEPVVNAWATMVAATAPSTPKPAETIPTPSMRRIGPMPPNIANATGRNRYSPISAPCNTAPTEANGIQALTMRRGHGELICKKLSRSGVRHAKINIATIPPINALLVILPSEKGGSVTPWPITACVTANCAAPTGTVRRLRMLRIAPTAL